MPLLPLHTPSSSIRVPPLHLLAPEPEPSPSLGSHYRIPFLHPSYTFMLVLEPLSTPPHLLTPTLATACGNKGAQNHHHDERCTEEGVVGRSSSPSPSSTIDSLRRRSPLSSPPPPSSPATIAPPPSTTSPPSSPVSRLHGLKRKALPSIPTHPLFTHRIMLASRKSQLVYSLVEEGARAEDLKVSMLRHPNSCYGSEVEVGGSGNRHGRAPRGGGGDFR